MEVAIIWFLSMYGMGEYIKSVENHNKALGAYIARVDEEINEIDNTLASHEKTIIKTAGAHSSFYAGQQLKNTQYEQGIAKINDILKEMSAGESSTISSDVPNKP